MTVEIERSGERRRGEFERMTDLEKLGGPIETRLEPISAGRIEAFKRAVRADHEKGVPLTFGTLYRHGEFEWVKRLGFDLRQVLHTEQEYEYLAPLDVGADPVIVTSLKNFKTRSAMVFITLESEVRVGQTLCVLARTSFLIRQAVGGQA